MLREQRLPSNNSGRAPGGLDDGSGAEEADAGAGEMSVPPRIFSLVVALIPVEAPGVHAWRTHDALRTRETRLLGRRRAEMAGFEPGSGKSNG